MSGHVSVIFPDGPRAPLHSHRNELRDDTMTPIFTALMFLAIRPTVSKLAYKIRLFDLPHISLDIVSECATAMTTARAHNNKNRRLTRCVHAFTNSRRVSTLDNTHAYTRHAHTRHAFMHTHRSQRQRTTTTTMTPTTTTNDGSIARRLCVNVLFPF